jgi:kynurenine 3-monooxygenase
MERITLIGAGLAGSLLAIILAKRGYQVEIFEKRNDMRKQKVEAGRSINLALSHRGLRGLERAGIGKEILENAVKMPCRMLHTIDNQLLKVPYGKNENEYINSISRAGLNIVLLNLAEKFENITIHFGYELTEADIPEQTYTFFNKNNQKTEKYKFQRVLATDGAGSVLRKGLKFQSNFKESVDFLEHGYKELTILPDENGNFKMEKNALHIWPRGAYMLIALPNLDGSFTCTLFFPNEGENSFATLNTDEKIKDFFEKNFNDALNLLPNLIEDFKQNPVGVLGTVRCNPWHFEDKLLLLGDAAHAIVPFYGQGMNCSFEDCVLLDDLIEKYEGNWQQIFEIFNQIRPKDTNAIADLALENFYEMRDGTAEPAFLRKRQLENILENKYTDYHSKYSLVTFQPDVPYSEAHQKGNFQDQYLLDLCKNIENIQELNVENIYQDLKEKWKIIKNQ